LKPVDLVKAPGQMRHFEFFEGQMFDGEQFSDVDVDPGKSENS
jgi:hypothetical protein